LSPAHQRQLFLLASGLSTAGSFAGLTAKGWILMNGSGSALLLALHFAALALPSLLVSGPAGVVTDRLGCRTVLIRAQWGLFAAAVLGALAIPLLAGAAQMAALLISTLLVGLASSYELTARNKYAALLVERSDELAPYLASFSVVFNVGKLVGPPLGGWLVALQGPAGALAIDAATYLLPIVAVLWLLDPHGSMERRSCGVTLRHVLRFTALSCLVGFFHPGLAPLIAAHILGPTPQALGWFTSVLATGSIVGGVVLQKNSSWLSQRPGLLMGTCTVLTALAQLGMAAAQPDRLGWLAEPLALAMVFLIGAGTASLLAGVNLIGQVGAPMAIRGRMAGLGQIAFLGGGGLSGLVAAGLTATLGLPACFALLGGSGLVIGVAELIRHGDLRLRPGELRST
jgi:MFS family permease